jgi:hypothetical protein
VWNDSEKGRELTTESPQASEWIIDKNGGTMERSASRERKSTSEQISKRIEELGDWRGKTLSSVRELTKDADPEITKESKWAKATSPG